MPLPEGYLPREGDIVIVHAKVKYDANSQDDRAYIKVVGSHQDISVPFDKIAGLHCRHWDVGAKVQINKPFDRRLGEVVAIDDDMVWVKLSDNLGDRFRTLHANAIEPIPEEPKPEPPIEEPPPTPEASAQGGDNAQF